MDPLAGLQASRQAVSDAYSQQADLPTILRETLTKKFTRNNPLFAQRDQAVQNLMNVEGQTYNEFSQPQTVTIGGGQQVAPGQNPVGDQATVSNVYLSPAQQQATLRARTASRLTPVMTLNDLIYATTGGLNNIIKDTTEAYKGETERRKTEFDMDKAIAELGLKDKELGIKQTEKTAADKKYDRQNEEAVEGIDRTLSSLQKVRETVSKGGTGIEASDLFGLRSGLPKWLGGIGTKTVDARNALAELNQYWFGLAGKALTKSEIENIRIPKENERQDIILGRLAEMEKTLRQKKIDLQSGGSLANDEEDTGSSGSSGFTITEVR